MAMKQIQGLMKPLKKYTKQTLSALFSGRSKGPVKVPNYVFMNIAIKIDVKGHGWQKLVAKVLNGIQGVAHFNMEDDGTVVISGTVNPPLLLKRLGKAGTRATIKHWQYGQCSSNMYSVLNPYSHNNSNYYQGNNMYYSQRRGYDYPMYGGNVYDYPMYGGNVYDYPPNRGYGYDFTKGNNHSYARYGGDDYGYDPCGNNGYGYGGNHLGLGREYGSCRY